jgi:type VI protein secretion system component VasK
MLGDPQTQYWIILGFSTLSAIFWLIGALSAFINYRAYTQTQDLGWAITFALFALVHAGGGWVAYRTLADWHDLAGGAQQLADLRGSYQATFAALDACATIAFIYFFRMRRKSF